MHIPQQDKNDMAYRITLYSMIFSDD